MTKPDTRAAEQSLHISEKGGLTYAPVERWELRDLLRYVTYAEAEIERLSAMVKAGERERVGA
jgi:hypothetical protein